MVPLELGKEEHPPAREEPAFWKRSVPHQQWPRLHGHWQQPRNARITSTSKTLRSLRPHEWCHFWREGLASELLKPPPSAQETPSKTSAKKGGDGCVPVWPLPSPFPGLCDVHYSHGLPWLSWPFECNMCGYRSHDRWWVLISYSQRRAQSATCFLVKWTPPRDDHHLIIPCHS